MKPKGMSYIAEMYIVAKIVKTILAIAKNLRDFL